MGAHVTFADLDSMEIKSLETVQSNIRSGDLIFCSGNYPISGLIRLATDSVWSHVGTIFQSEELGGTFVIESIESIGVRLVPLARFLADYRDSLPYSGKCIVARADLPDSFSADSALKFGAPLLGTAYDGWENAGILWRLMSRYDRYSDNDRYNCAEFATELLEAGGYRPDFEKRLANTPEGVWRACVVDVLGRIR